MQVSINQYRHPVKPARLGKAQLLVIPFRALNLAFVPSERKRTSTPLIRFIAANLEWIEGVAILVAVLVVVFVTAINDWRKERQFRGLQNKIEKDHQTSVIRDNHIQQIPVSELVVGDLCFIKYGRRSSLSPLRCFDAR